MRRLLLGIALLALTPVSASAQLTTSLIAYWELGEASGNRADSHGSNTLADNNTVTQAAGKVGNAADFERDNTEYLSIADNAALSTGDIDVTMCAWVYFESLAMGAGQIRQIISKEGASDGEYYLFYDSTADRLSFTVYGASAYGSGGAVNWGSAPSATTWYFVCGEHNASANTIRIKVNDGAWVSVGHSAGIFDSDGAFRLGLNSAAQSMDGLIDQVGFWKRTLTDAEHSFLYNSGNGRSYADVVTGLPAGAFRPLLMLGVG
jgi:hypothetical protein